MLKDQSTVAIISFPHSCICIIIRPTKEIPANTSFYVSDILRIQSQYSGSSGLSSETINCYCALFDKVCVLEAKSCSTFYDKIMLFIF